MNVLSSPSRLGFLRAPLLIVFFQVLFGGCAVALGIAAGVPWSGLAGMGLATALGASVARKGVSSTSDLLGWWGCSLLLPVSLLFYHPVIPVSALHQTLCLGLLGATALGASVRLAGTAAQRAWRVAGLVWAGLGLLLTDGVCYAENLKGGFYLAVILTIALGSLYMVWYRPRAWVIQTLNTLNLLAAVLLVVGLFQGPRPTVEGGPIEPGTPYRYATALKDPAAFRRWWSQYAPQWQRLVTTLFEIHPDSPLFYRPRPGGETMFMNSHVVLNRHGFRGKEVAEPKGNIYRVVTLGESTTFGSTINPGERPWPELLEQMIRERLHPQRPVEVVNAAIPGFALTNNLCRLSTDILPLKPDLLLSYHGYNGFPLLYEKVPPKRNLFPPVYEPRPVRLLAQCEYSLRVFWYQHRPSPRRLAPKAVSAAMQTDYARAYRSLIDCARTNSFRLGLATYSMAINRHSDPGVISFFQIGFKEAPVAMEANEVHSFIVRQLCEQNPEVIYVDTRPSLDGQHDLYLDLMHFAQEGDRRLAEAMFQAIKPALEHDLMAGQAR